VSAWIVAASVLVSWLAGLYAGICWGKTLKRDQIHRGLELMLHNGYLRRQVELHEAGECNCEVAR
jgi:hypothetical protein